MDSMCRYGFFGEDELRFLYFYPSGASEDLK